MCQAEQLHRIVYFFALPISHYVSQIYIVTVDNYKLFITLIATP